MISDTAFAAICLMTLVPLIGIVAVDAMREALPLRGDLLSRFVLLRLPTMLKRHGIDVKTHFRRTSPRRIAAQMRSCETCQAKNLCDMSLQSTGEEDFAFCPSRPQIAAH